MKIETRTKTFAITVDHLTIGGGAPVAVQSMTSTDTEDVDASVRQCLELSQAGSELIRLTVNTDKAARAIVDIKEKLLQKNINTPLIGDFHFNGHKLLLQNSQCAQALSKYRINPGNVGKGKQRDRNFEQMIEIAIQYQKPVRIGVNWGSIDQQLLAALMDQNQQRKQPLDSREIMYQAMIRSALDSAVMAEKIGLAKNRIILSCKMSAVPDLIQVYQRLASACRYPLHLGLTEAGMGSKGIVASTAALAILLQQGIGDTIRVSLTPQPGESRCTEVRVAQQVLQALQLRAFTPVVISCPGCGRTSSDFFQQLAQQTQNWIGEQMPFWRKQYPGVENLKIAVMGCVVNGPGESKQADIGISLPGNGEKPVAPVYQDGGKTVTLKGAHIADEFQQIILNYVKQKYNPL